MSWKICFSIRTVSGLILMNHILIPWNRDDFHPYYKRSYFHSTLGSFDWLLRANGDGEATEARCGGVGETIASSFESLPGVAAHCSFHGQVERHFTRKQQVGFLNNFINLPSVSFFLPYLSFPPILSLPFISFPSLPFLPFPSLPFLPFPIYVPSLT